MRHGGGRRNSVESDKRKMKMGDKFSMSIFEPVQSIITAME